MHAELFSQQGLLDDFADKLIGLRRLPAY